MSWYWALFHGRVITLATARVLGGVAARAPSSSPCEHSTILNVRLQARQLPLSSLDSQIYSEICNPRMGTRTNTMTSSMSQRGTSSRCGGPMDTHRRGRRDSLRLR